MQYYARVFVMETSVLHLKEVSGYSRAYIMLMSFKDFTLEVKKYNLKLDAQAAENKAYLKQLEGKNKK